METARHRILSSTQSMTVCEPQGPVCRLLPCRAPVAPPSFPSIHNIQALRPRHLTLRSPEYLPLEELTGHSSSPNPLSLKMHPKSSPQIDTASSHPSSHDHSHQHPRLEKEDKEEALPCHRTKRKNELDTCFAPNSSPRVYHGNSHLCQPPTPHPAHLKPQQARQGC